MLDDEALLKQCRFEFLKGSGPGGQNRNRRMTAVRLYHDPSGIVLFCCEERTQLDNRRVAFERLKKRLADLERVEKPRIATRQPRSAKRKRLEGKAVRSELKRTRRGPSSTDYE